MKNTQMRDPHEVSASLHEEGRFLPYLLWLIWVIWLPFALPNIIDFFQSHPSMPRLIATLVAIVLFFAVYLWATWRNAQRLVGASSSTIHTQISPWLPIVVLSALSLAIVLLYKGLGTPFIFTSAYMGGRLPTKRAIQAVVALTLLVAVLGSINDPNDWSYLGQGVVFVLVVGLVTISMVRSVTTGRELRAAREEIARLAVMTERLRIARDLHDLLGHNLSLIALKSELAGRLLSVAPERAAIEVGDIENVARTTLQEVREAVGSYRQPTLSSELHAAQEILAAAGIAYHYVGTNPDRQRHCVSSLRSDDLQGKGDENIMRTLPTVIEAVLAWTVREGVTNVIRHSRARQCTIRVTQDIHTACVEVLDDGISAPLVTASQAPGATSTGGSLGNGLRGLAERVQALGGHYEAGSRANGGFRLLVSVPLAQRKQAQSTAGAAAQRVALASPEERLCTAEDRHQSSPATTRRVYAARQQGCKEKE